jgi:hypothetical protein
MIEKWSIGRVIPSPVVAADRVDQTATNRRQQVLVNNQ